MLKPTSQSNAPRILHLVHWLNRGGIEMWLLEMIRQVGRKSFVMDVCCKGPSLGELAEDFRQAEANLYHLPQQLGLWRSVAALRDLLISQRYDALHVHTGVHSGWAVRAARLAGVPVITTFHNTQYPRESAWTSRFLLGQAVKRYARWSLRYAVTKSQIATAVSKGVADVVQQVSRLKGPTCDVVYLGVSDPPILSCHEIELKRRELKVSPQDKVILHVGSLTEQKNHLGLLEVFRRIHSKLPQAKLLLAGEGHLRESIERRILELELGSVVQLLGLRSDVQELMHLSDLFLFPSIREGLSLTLMEASAARLPIVASSIPGNVEATAGGKAARLHEPGDHASMANSVCELIQQPSLASELTRHARQTYEQKFSLEVSTERWQNLYKHVILDSAGRQLQQPSQNLQERAA